MKEKIADFLYENLSYAYCDTCDHTDSGSCDYCNRKSIGWSLSETRAVELAEEIIHLLDE